MVADPDYFSNPVSNQISYPDLIWISDFKSRFDPDLNFLRNPDLKLFRIRLSNPDSNHIF